MTHHCRGEAVTQRHLTIGAAHLVGTQHESRKVERPFVLSRDVRTVHVAEFALKAFVDDLVLLSGCESAGVLIIMLIDHLEQRRKRRAELETQPTPMAQVVHPGEFAANVCFVEIVRVVRVIGDGHCKVSSSLRVNCWGPPKRWPPTG